ncbi:MAG: hypothetical protein VKN60_03545 [Cyanobacteriota bacterium]|nr:hypothetical protein [Cyanobacteriota bacterium]
MNKLNKIKILIIVGLAGGALLLAAALLLTVGRNIGQFFFGRSFAEEQLSSYVANVMQEEVKGSQCQQWDTDSNGYVSCTYTLVSQPGKPYAIECAAWGLDGFLNRGCKPKSYIP